MSCISTTLDNTARIDGRSHVTLWPSPLILQGTKMTFKQTKFGSSTCLIGAELD